MKAYKVGKDGEIKEASKHQCQLEFYTLAEDRSCYNLDETVPFDVLRTSKLYQAFWCRNEVFFFSQTDEQVSIHIIDECSNSFLTMQID